MINIICGFMENLNKMLPVIPSKAQVVYYEERQNCLHISKCNCGIVFCFYIKILFVYQRHIFKYVTMCHVV